MRTTESVTARVSRLMPRLHAEMRDIRSCLDALGEPLSEYSPVGQAVSSLNDRLDLLLSREHRLDLIAAMVEGRDLQTARTA